MDSHINKQAAMGKCNQKTIAAPPNLRTHGFLDDSMSIDKKKEGFAI